MIRIVDLIRTRPVLTYFVLTFLISWGSAVLVAGGPGGFPANEKQVEALLPLMVLALVAGPVTSGLLMTAIVSGRSGLRHFAHRLLAWRVGAPWYLVALLTAPLVVLVTLLVLSLSSASFLPGIFTANDKAAILLAGLAAGLTAGLFEEAGWTGFATPRLRSRYGVLATGLIVGFLWGVWHFIVALWASGTPSGDLSVLILSNQVTFYVGVLPAYRVLMVWVYDRTESLWVAMLMHGSLTAFTTFIFAPLVTDAQRLIYHLVLSGLMWVVVAVAALASKGQLSRQDVPTRMAQGSGHA